MSAITGIYNPLPQMSVSQLTNGSLAHLTEDRIYDDKRLNDRVEPLKASQQDATQEDYIAQAEALIEQSLPKKPPNTKLRIDLDDTTGRFIYQGVDVSTGDIVTQFPADEVLRFLSYYREKEGLEGIVVDEFA